MSLLDQCRHCDTPLSADEKASRLCDECSYFADDYYRYDALREEGYMPHQAKLSVAWQIRQTQTTNNKPIGCHHQPTYHQEHTT
ncbi:hypothetical protein IFT96_03615 [Pseudomonas fluorescens]|nr:hypothetical protein [Pseudomonas fluorescens]